MVDVAPKFYHLAVKAYHEKNLTELYKNSKSFIMMLHDLDEILATNQNFLLGVWLQEAKSIPEGNKYQTAESYLYEFNARNQITLWGPNGDILDYATRQWSGIVKDYYIPRWRLFYDRLMKDVKFNITFHQEKYKHDFIEKIGKPFTLDRRAYPSTPNGDTIAVAQKLYKRWRHVLNPLDGFYHSYQVHQKCEDERFQYYKN